MSVTQQQLIAAAREASGRAYAPYSRFHVGAALAFADGGIVAASNAENASYGLTLCAEAVAVAVALGQGRRGGLVAVAVSGGPSDAAGHAMRGETPVTPCGRCRQMLSELASLDRADPLVWCDSAGEEVLELRLSELLPHAFRKDNLQG